MYVRMVCAMAAVCAAAAAQDQAATIPNAQGQQRQPLTLRERARIYLKSAVGPGSILSSAASAGFDQWRDSPPEWRDGMAGYGRRFGYALAGSVASNGLEFAVSAVRHEDTRYVRSSEKGFIRRSMYVVVHTYIVPRDGGGTTFAASRLMGAYGTAFIARAWAPARINSTGDALLFGTWALMGDMGNSAFAEFWPDIKRKVLRRK